MQSGLPTALRLAPAALALTVLALACRFLTQPDRFRVLGTIAGYEDDPRIDIVQTGREVTVTVTTYGDACYSRGETVARVDGLEARVTPYDHTAPPGTACARILRTFEHRAALSFKTGGKARVLVRGLRTSGDTLTAERTVQLP